MVFPVYLLRFNNHWQVVFPQGNLDIGHTDFWEQTVSRMVADHYKIPPSKLANLPYCERRARIVAKTVYYGERPGPELLKAIRNATGDSELMFCFDEHERRLKEDVLEFRRLMRRHSVSDRNQFVGCW